VSGPPSANRGGYPPSWSFCRRKMIFFCGAKRCENYFGPKNGNDTQYFSKKQFVLPLQLISVVFDQIFHFRRVVMNNFLGRNYFALHKKSNEAKWRAHREESASGRPPPTGPLACGSRTLASSPCGQPPGSFLSFTRYHTKVASLLCGAFH